MLVSHIHMRHGGGTKFYSMTALQAANHSLLVKNYGRIGAPGQILVTESRSSLGARDAMRELTLLKTERGYVPDLARGFDCLRDLDPRVRRQVDEIMRRSASAAAWIAKFGQDETPESEPSEVEAASPAEPAPPPPPRAIELLPDYGDW